MDGNKGESFKPLLKKLVDCIKVMSQRCWKKHFLTFFIICCNPWAPVGENNGTHYWKLCHSPCIFHKRQWDLGFLESINFCTSFFETNAAVSFSAQSALAVKARPGTSIAKYLRERVWKPPQAIQSTRPPGVSLLTRKNAAFPNVSLLQEFDEFSTVNSQQQIKFNYNFN